MAADPGIWCPHIHLADDTRRPRPWRTGLRVATHWIAVVSLEGAERITVDGRTYDIPSGCGYLIQPGSAADLGSPGGSRPLWVHFDLAYDPLRAQHPQVHGYAPLPGPRAAWMQPRAPALLGRDLPVAVPAAALTRFRAGVQAAVGLWRAGDG
ncbi:MAG: AraC family ligand binding domain-containing protein, partial [Planctomycetes bacterium]|nr:AraC family ligand binding domain-containing protein [Planctomycetota bacterium]